MNLIWTKNLLKLFQKKTEVLELFLQVRYEEIQVTEEVVIAVAENKVDADTMRLVLDPRKVGEIYI